MLVHVAAKQRQLAFTRQFALPFTLEPLHIFTLDHLDAFLLGVLGARVAHVLWHAADYLPQPLSIIRLGDGGYSVWAGVAVASGVANVASAAGGWMRNQAT